MAAEAPVAPVSQHVFAGGGVEEEQTGRRQLIRLVALMSGIFTVRYLMNTYWRRRVGSGGSRKVGSDQEGFSVANLFFGDGGDGGDASGDGVGGGGVEAMHRVRRGKRSYEVRRVDNGLNDEAVADYLHRIHSDLVKVSQTNKEPSMEQYMERLRASLPTLKIRENPLRYPEQRFTSYSVNKGEKMVMCVRDPSTNDVHDYNTIMYVALHEAAHIACPDVGHTKLFKEIQRYLVRSAIELGVYEDKDYQDHPQSYCGITINESLL